VSEPSPIWLATRGSPLALAQANTVLARLRAAFPERAFELRLIKTTGDKLQKASLANPAASLPKGLFTKELEVALLAGEAALAVHSLKDLPTELPPGLELGAVLPRADARDVLVYRRPETQLGRGYPPRTTVADLAPGATVATSSTRRREQLLAARPDLHVVEIRGNVGTRLGKVATRAELDATLLAAAGLLRLGFQFGADGVLAGPPAEPLSSELRVSLLGLGEMIPAVGQAAIGIECRSDDSLARELCASLNHAETFQAITAERAFLRAMGGGCQSPVAAHASLEGGRLVVRAVSFRNGPARHGLVEGAPADAKALGESLARLVGD
jgi:hydroxymethylbilane synthase